MKIKHIICLGTIILASLLLGDGHARYAPSNLQPTKSNTPSNPAQKDTPSKNEPGKKNTQPNPKLTTIPPGLQTQ